MVLMPQIPEQLVTDVLAGNNSAFGELYRLTAPALRTYIARGLKGNPDFEDYTQDVFIRLHGRIHNGFPLNGKNIGGMLYTIAHNLVADHYKSARIKTRAEYVELLDAEGSPVAAFEPTTETQEIRPDDPRGATETVAEHRELAAVLERKLARLVPNQRRALVLKYYEGMSNRQVGQVLGINEGAVKGLVWRALNAVARNENTTRS